MTTRKRTTRHRHPKLDPLDLLMKLLVIPGVSGSELAVSDFVQSQLRGAGAEPSAIVQDDVHRRSPVPGNTGNLVFKLDGGPRAPRRLLMAHLDTVPVCLGSAPIRRGSTIQSADPATGVGADNRCGVAVVLHTALRLLRERPDHPPLTFLWTVQEEIGLHGARLLRKSQLGKPRLAFNWDGGPATAATIGATGGYRMTMEVFGLASHAGNAPENGVSAIAIAAQAIADLCQHGWHGKVAKNGQMGTSNIGVIQGGDATNVVTSYVRLRAEARSHNARFRQRIVNEIESAFRKAARQCRNQKGESGRVQFDGALDYEAFELSRQEPCVQEVCHAIRAIGFEPELRVTNGGLDANWMVQHGIPTVSLGCGQRNPHMTNEQVVIDEFLTACEVAWQLATGTRSTTGGTR
jgi:tripeptide aminopeptidase